MIAPGGGVAEEEAEERDADAEVVDSDGVAPPDECDADECGADVVDFDEECEVGCALVGCVLAEVGCGGVDVPDEDVVGDALTRAELPGPCVCVALLGAALCDVRLAASGVDLAEDVSPADADELCVRPVAPEE
jgi:hypothetical protein